MLLYPEIVAECFSQYFIGSVFSQERYTPKETILLHIGISNVLITLFTVYKNDIVDSKP